MVENIAPRAMNAPANTANASTFADDRRALATPTSRTRTAISAGK
jgi:hypothetical protein